MTVRFGACVLDREKRELRRGGDAVHLTPKAFELLSLVSMCEVQDQPPESP